MTRYDLSHDLRLIALVMKHPEGLRQWANAYLFENDGERYSRISDMAMGGMHLAEAVMDIYNRMQRDGRLPDWLQN